MLASPVGVQPESLRLPPSPSFADYVSGGELFTHLYQRDHFSEEEVRFYSGEIILALEHLHKVRVGLSIYSISRAACLPGTEGRSWMKTPVSAR